MDIYEYCADVTNYAWITPKKDKDLDITSDLNGKSLADGWRKFSIYKIDKNRTISDFPCLAIASIPVMSERAADSLSDLLQSKGEFLELNSKYGKYYIFNVLNFIDVFDEHRSEIRKTCGVIVQVFNHVFYSDRISTDEVIFKVHQMPYDVFVTDIFLNRVKESGLKGLNCEKVWSI